MRSRRKAREGALRVLYEVEIGNANLAEAIEGTVQELEIAADLAEYMERLVRGVRQHRREIDDKIARHLKGYDLDRLAAIDRTILRIGTFELLHVPEMPPAVTINEAIEIAKRFSTAESGKFVNGVLGGVLPETPKAHWDPASASPEASESPVEPAPVEIEELEVTPENELFRAASRVGGWKIRAES